MFRLALLPRESSNRVWNAEAATVLAAELEAVADLLVAPAGEVGIEAFGGEPHVLVDLDAEQLDDHDRFVLSNLALVRLLSERVDGDLLRPIESARLELHPSDLLTIQRYQGKTNEQFTHLLVNLALARSSSARTRSARGERVRLLDPVAGRGTTLNRALMYGMDATGIERNENDVDQYRTFLTTWLQDKRMKHSTERARIRKGPHAGSSSFTVEIRNGSTVHMVRGSSTAAAGLLPGRRFDLLVGDLPYGVQHTAGGKGGDARSPGAFVEEALPSWHKVLEPGGAIGLSWNLRTLGREVMVDLLESNGFGVVEPPSSFEHVVDRSITRDLVVATRP